MIRVAALRRLLLALVLLAPAPVVAQTHIEAPGGVAAQTITGSPITIGAKPEVLVQMADIFAQKIAVSDAARAQAEKRATEFAVKLGDTQDAVIGFFRSLGEQNVSVTQIQGKFIEIAVHYREMQDRWSVLDTSDPIVAGLATQAKAALDKGRYDAADALLVQAEAHDADIARQAEKLALAAQQSADAHWLHAAETEAKRGDLAMTRLRYLDAAQRYAAAAGMVPTVHQDVAVRYREQEAGALYKQGDERGDNQAAAQAISRYRSLADGTNRATAALDWAMRQNNLGTALLRLGERESGTANLDAAVAAYRAALEERTRARVPLDWAMTQNNLGNALLRLGERESGTVHLDAAVAAYRAALEERTRERVPLDWAMTQNNLGTALETLGEREIGTAHLDAAVAAYRAALEEWTRERVPLDWATTQNNLGNALETLGKRESGTAHLDAAVVAYRAALEERTRERVPLDWAMTQNNLGTALLRLGERESGTVHLDAAVAAYRAALEEWTRELVPLDWATTQYNLGNALVALGDREHSSQQLAAAVAAWNACLSVAETAWPPEWVLSVKALRSEAQGKLVKLSAK